MTNKTPEISQIGFSGTRWFKPWPFDPPNVGGQVYSHWKGRVFTIPKRSKKLPGKSAFFHQKQGRLHCSDIGTSAARFFFLGFYWVKRMVRKLRDIFLCFPIFGCSLFVAHPGELLLWNSHKSSKHPKKRSSTVMVFPLRSVRRLRRWIVGTCRRELQVANGAWEMLQGKPWASWGRFFLNFMLAFVWLEEIFATQNTQGRKECNNLWVFFFEFSGQSVWSGNVVTPCLFALLHPHKFGCDWWWRQQKNPTEGLWTLLHPLFLWQLPQGREFWVLPPGTQRIQVEVGQGVKKTP